MEAPITKRFDLYEGRFSAFEYYWKPNTHNTINREHLEQLDNDAADRISKRI